MSGSNGPELSQALGRALALEKGAGECSGPLDRLPNPEHSGSLAYFADASEWLCPLMLHPDTGKYRFL